MVDVSEAVKGDSKVPICPSIPSGEQTVWANASSLLHLACNDLRDGELIYGENFNLFAAMSALEIMDPKMDSGMVRTYYSVDEAIEYGAAPIPLSLDKTVDVQRIIDIMDHLLACEATWHKGCSLAQTVFSCLYLLRPDRTSSHALLHSYCRVMRATCNAVVCTVSDTRTNEVASRHFPNSLDNCLYNLILHDVPTQEKVKANPQEEDLFTMTHGLPLKVDGDDKCLTMLHAVEETIARQLRACKATLSKKRVTEDIEPLQNNPDLEEGLCKSLLCQLRFRKALLQKVTAVPLNTYTIISLGFQHFYHVVMNIKRPQGRGLELAKKHIACCFEELDSMIKSADFLRSISAPEDGMKNETTASGCQPVGFDSTLNSRLSAPTPPRAIETISWKKAAEYFQKLLHELEIICSYNLDPVFEGLLRFVVEFQKLRPELVARAHLQTNQQHLLVQDGKLYGRDSVFSVICKASLLPEVAKNHDIQKIEPVVQLGQLELAFRKECGDISATSSNENICMKICRHILIWVEEQTYWIASRFLMLGFELDLYSPGEYCMVYWYMYIILIKLAEKTHMRAMTSNDITEGFLDKLKEWWQGYTFSGSPDYILTQKLKNLKKDITSWNREVFGKLETRKSKALDELLALEQLAESRPASTAESAQMQNLRVELQKLAKAEETSWRQKSRCLWLKEGDRNTKYFQKVANSQRRYNIDKLSVGSEIIEDQEQIRKEILDLYENLYTEQEPWRPSANFEGLANITGEESMRLEGIFEEEEVFAVIKSCSPDKAPGPNGFTMAFFQISWGFIKLDVMGALNYFHQHGSMVRSSNASFIALVPKKKRSNSPKRL
ncbi:putative N-alpha-acetyltransferase 35, NatC auxiliary subunit-like isoform X2 [Capsicum annuum]|nr:putative N-alpha-acetyltransferase 35, NatC auxiliary subunit-like isoform X2 [Capsicum annuum]